LSRERVDMLAISTRFGGRAARPAAKLVACVSTRRSPDVRSPPCVSISDSTSPCTSHPPNCPSNLLSCSFRESIQKLLRIGQAFETCAVPRNRSSSLSNRWESLLGQSTDACASENMTTYCKRLAPPLIANLTALAFVRPIANGGYQLPGKAALTHLQVRHYPGFHRTQRSNPPACQGASWLPKAPSLFAES
jgi:hypothetical protein